MSKQRLRPLALVLALAGSVLLAEPAQAQKLDAIRAADFAARTAVQTIYHNLITHGYEWQWIRDEKMPEILVRAVGAIKRESSKMDRELVLNTFIPTYVTSFFEEIDRINQQHQVRCIDVTFVVLTLIPFFRECKTQLGDYATVTEIVVPVLRAEYAMTICQPLRICQEALSDKYFIVFNERLPMERFYEVCVGEE